MTEQLTRLTAGARIPATPTAGNGLDRLSKNKPAANEPDRMQRLKKACEDMEALFVHQLIKEMRATIPKSGLFGKSHAQDIYTGMLDGRMAQEIAQSRGLGLSGLLMRQLGAADSPADEN